MYIAKPPPPLTHALSLLPFKITIFYFITSPNKTQNSYKKTYLCRQLCDQKTPQKINREAVKIHTDQLSPCSLS